MATTDPGVLAQTPAPIPSATDEVPNEVIGRTPWQLFWLRFKKDKAALAGACFVVLLVLIALLAPLIADHVVHHGMNEINQELTTSFGAPNVGPSKENWFGVDRLGRDVFVRTLYGTRVSLLVALFATMVSVFIGVTLGMLAGFRRGWVDTVISRAIDVVLAMPLLVFSIGIATVCGVSKEGCFGGLLKPGISLIVFIIALFSWTFVARIVRGQTLSMREREFVEAARSIGASSRRIMFREMLPNLVAPIIIYASLLIPANISFEAYLSFFGLGVVPPTPSWGGMIADGSTIYEIAWWMMVFPGLFLLFTTLAFNLLGDGLRDALDPKTGRG